MIKANPLIRFVLADLWNNRYTSQWRVSVFLAGLIIYADGPVQKKLLTRLKLRIESITNEQWSGRDRLCYGKD